MSGAPEKRHTVRVLAAAGISTRRACALVGTSRSHLAYEAKAKDDDDLLAVIAEIRRRKLHERRSQPPTTTTSGPTTSSTTPSPRGAL